MKPGYGLMPYRKLIKEIGKKNARAYFDLYMATQVKHLFALESLFLWRIQAHKLEALCRTLSELLIKGRPGHG